MRLSVDAENINYRDLNRKVREFLNDNTGSNNKKVIINNALGHKYIGDGLKADVVISINGIPGNDLGAFMDGPQIEVFGNVQDSTGNTMNSGRIVIYGNTGDITGYSMRGGEIYIKENTGLRSGIHMKSYHQKMPVMVIGGSAGNFLGEYMAGGIIIVLGLYKKKKEIFTLNNAGRNGVDIVGNYTGTGMHGGRIYIRGEVEDYRLGGEVKKTGPDSDDLYLLDKYIKNYNNFFNSNRIKIPVSKNDFIKLIPCTHRPYGKLYAY
jgi:glutamate synthase domain-containing protein 3